MKPSRRRWWRGSAGAVTWRSGVTCGPGQGPYEVQIRYRDRDTGAGQELTTMQTDRAGYFHFAAGYRKGREWRAICVLPSGARLEGPFVRSYRFG